jgi:hypothetical protein
MAMTSPSRVTAIRSPACSLELGGEAGNVGNVLAGVPLELLEPG